MKIGPLVDAHAAPRPERIMLPGRYVTLEPLQASLHTASLWDIIRDSSTDPLWTYLADGPYPDQESLHAGIARRESLPDAVFYAIMKGGRAVGWASLMRIDTANRVIEVGNILYTPHLQRTPAGTEAMYLLAKYIFEDLGYRRYEWKCNDLNEPSKRAAVRYGFVYEGLFRQHMITKGRTRDTAWYSMLDSEWPARKAEFDAWLDPANFDAQGNQIAPLRTPA